MKVQDSEVFKRFWYVATRVTDLDDGPKPFKLFGQEMVVWKGADGTVSVLADHCCHRSARLSLGEVIGNRISCPYHGWQFAASGQCEVIPQMPELTPPASSCVTKFRSQVRYGLVWVALEKPLTDVPDLPEADLPGYRLIQEFHEIWDMSLFRLIDNWFDLAHVSFVHRGTQGDIDRPVPPEDTLEEHEFGVTSSNLILIANRAEGQSYTGISDAQTTRDRKATWFAPNARKLHIGYPNGLQHIIFTTATPTGDNQILFTQLCIRNDTEEVVPAATAIAFDRRVTAEDKIVLESTLADVPIMADEKAEQGMKADRAQILARRKLRDIVTTYDIRFRQMS